MSCVEQTYFVGGKEAVDSDTVRLVQTAYECLFEAIKAVKPGELYRSLGSKIQPWAEHNGCNVCNGSHGCTGVTARWTPVHKRMYNEY